MITKWTFPEGYDGPEPCPEGCGNLTDDVAGGPCSSCWDSILADQEAQRQEDLAEFKAERINSVRDALTPRQYKIGGNK